MKQDKDLQLKYLCMALPYGVVIEYNNDGFAETREMGLGSLHDFMFDNAEIKPYLRPMSSMTDEEMDKYHSYCLCDGGDFTGSPLYFDTIKSIDYLYSIHVDVRGLIPKGLAIEVTESNNPYKE